jgi:hypothetical protein
MSNPKAEGQPDTYAGTNWVSQIVAQEAQMIIVAYIIVVC